MLLSFLVVWWLSYVKAQGEDGIKSSCVAPQSYIGDTASITCSFSVDLFKESKAFRMYRYDVTRSSIRTANELVVLDCFFRDYGVEDCSSPAPGYRFNGTFTDKVTVTIPSVNPEFQGRYECRAEPSYPKYIDDCVFLIKAKPTTPFAITGRVSEQKNDAENTEDVEGGSRNTDGIVVGVVVAVLVLVGGIVLLVLWKRELIRLPCIKAKQQDKRFSDVENPDQSTVHLLPQVQPKKHTTRERSGNDSGENTVAVSDERRNDETEPRPVAHAAALNEDADDSSTQQNKVYVAENIQETRSTISGEATGEALANTNPSTESHVMELCSLNGSKKRPEDLQGPTEAVPKGPNRKQAVQPAVCTQSFDERARKTVEHEQQAAKPKHDKHDPVTSTGIGHQTADMSQQCQGATAGEESEKHDLDRKGEEKTAGAHDKKTDSKGLDDNITTILRSARQPREISSDTNHETANLQFYQNFMKCLPDGEFIDDIHKQWQNDPDLLEKKPDCVQWLFPTSEASAMNKYAQKLNSSEAKAIKEDKRAFARFLKTYRLMLISYGLKLISERTGEVESMEKSAERFKYLQDTHNYMRITRVLHCLGEMGLERYKKPLIEQILMEAWQGSLRGTLPSCRDFWIPTVVCAEEQKELKKLYKNASSCKSVYVSER